MAISQTAIKEHVSSTEQSGFEIVIQPNRSWFYIDWRGLLHYRDLLFLLVRRDFVSQYKQTVLGPIWLIVPSLLTTIAFTVIFNKVAKISTDGMPPMLFYLCGLLAWRYFTGCLNSTSNTLTANAGLFGKVYFPRLIVPLSVVVSNLFSFVINLITFLGFYFYFKCFTPVGMAIKPNLFIFALPLLILQTAAFGLGVGLWISALTAKYRDFSFLVGFFTGVGMYVTPIIYPMSIVPEKWRVLVALNPMAPIIESFKYTFLGTGTINLNYLLISAVITIVVLLSGILIFNKVERTFIDTV